MRAGNVYVNRNMIGAVVGVQPFGGEGLSGTGPKAGGPHYLRRLVRDPRRCDAVERRNRVAGTDRRDQYAMAAPAWPGRVHRRDGKEVARADRDRDIAQATSRC